MARTLKSDRLLFWATLFLVGASVVMVFSASAVQAGVKNQASYHILLKQLAWATVGLILLLAVMRVDYHQLRRPAVIWSLIAVVTVGLLAVFAFPARNHARRWIMMGGLTVQPSELAKFAAVLFSAALLERRMHRVNDVGYTLVPIGLVAGGFAGLIVLQPDFGTAAVLLAVITSVIFAAGLSYRYLFGAMLLMAPAAMFLVVTAEYRMRRVLAFLDPWADQFGSGYQIVQALIAVGAGGVLGRGLMAGV